MKKEPLLDFQAAFNRLIDFLIRRYTVLRIVFLSFCDFAINFFSFIAAIYIYTRIVPVPYTWGIIYAIIFIAFMVKFTLFSAFRIYSISFQHASILYILKTSFVISAAAAVNYLILKSVFPGRWFFMVALLQFMFDIFGSISFRFLPLAYYEIISRMSQVEKSCLIYGCGDTGTSLIPVLRKSKIKIEGFIDDDPKNKGKIVNGIRVLGRFADSEKILTKLKAEVLIIAIPSLSGQRIKEIRRAFNKFNMELKIIPSLSQIYNKDLERMAASLRNINYEDLIRRPVKREDFSGLHDFFRSKKIVITGAGSIGSELLNQLINFDIKEILMLDNCELNLFNVQANGGKRQSAKVKARLLDLKNRRAVEKVFSDLKPDIVFHTAAYKHVPIVEENACEGVLNNLVCLKNVYEASEAAGVEKFIFISSDKAVRPTNIMGTTKRLGELYVQAKGVKNKMTSCAVRFGNVIGSSGSLVPKIVSQIQNNMAVTITHPEARRFFMLTSEAVLLILKATVFAKGGEIFILDMGEAINILDMAKEIIAFYGKTPGVDVTIEYIGLRPGEKLFEELVFDDIENTVYRDGMYIARPKACDYDKFIGDYDAIISLASEIKEKELLSLIKRYVDIYTNERLAKEEIR